MTVTLIYTRGDAVVHLLIPIGLVGEGQAFVAQVGEAIVGPRGGAVVALIVIVCVLGSLAAMQMLAPRTYFAMAQDGVFPAAAAAAAPAVRHAGSRDRDPGACSHRVLVALGTFDTIVAYFVFITVVFIAATVGSVFVLRRRDPGFKVPGYPWTPAAFSRMVAVLLTLLALNNPLQALLGLGLVAAALPVYHVIRPTPAARR